MTGHFTLTPKSEAALKLKSADPRVGRLIDLIGEINLLLRDDYFASLVRAVIGQQLSVKVATTIWNRTVNLCGEMKPEIILALNEDKLRTAGFSQQKIAYIKDLAVKVSCGEVKLTRLPEMADDEVIRTLTAIKGIGVWTAQMFLIFSLGRPDVFSTADLGLRRAVKWLYNLDEMPNSKELEKYSENWRPYRSAASLYLWEAINRGHVQ